MFQLESPYKPTGDQPQAIQALVDGIQAGAPAQVLLGVTGSGKTFTVANVIAQLNRPTLIMSHNKTLAAQLYSEMKAVQNIGLCLVPLLIGKLRVATNGYLVPMIVFASFGVLAFLLSLALKVEDKKKNYGLELPNKR